MKMFKSLQKWSLFRSSALKRVVIIVSFVLSAFVLLRYETFQQIVLNDEVQRNDFPFWKNIDACRKNQVKLDLKKYNLRKTK